MILTAKAGVRDARWMQCELFDPLQSWCCLQLREQGKSIHFCLALVKEEELKQVGGKSSFLFKLYTTCRNLVEVQWVFYTCGGGCTFSVFTFWCYWFYHWRHYHGLQLRSSVLIVSSWEIQLFESIILNKSPPSLIPGAFAYPRRCSSQTGVDNLPALRLAMMSPWISLAYVN